MGLFLICPHCRAKVPLASRRCPTCGGGLDNLPPEDRRYFIGSADPVAAPAPEVVFGDWPELPPDSLIADRPLTENRGVCLCEALDRILNKGAVLFGEVMISVADIDLVYLGLQVILSSMETAGGFKPVEAEPLGAESVR